MHDVVKAATHLYVNLSKKAYNDEEWHPFRSIANEIHFAISIDFEGRFRHHIGEDDREDFIEVQVETATLYDNWLNETHILCGEDLYRINQVLDYCAF